ncbi:MAG: hypothetical protein IJB19_04450 [Clostridia bacterium]|nr:hypothetical protein [Clostridia bacterium]
MTLATSRIKGIPVTLYERTQTGIDAANRPIYTETAITVDNVLIGAPTSEDVTNEFNLSGHRIAYTLGIPKGDTHDWNDVTVEFWGRKFRTVGVPTQGIEANIPLDWNMKVQVEAYE